MFKSFVISFVFAGLFTSIAAQLPSGKNWQIRYEDNFDGPTLDLSKWSFGFGWGTNSGSFSEKNRPSNLTFENGMAVIKAESENDTYYSAAINTRSKMVVKNGYWEAKIKVSKNVSGCIPAFWQKLNSDIWPPEVDIMEYFGTQKTQSLTVHYKNLAGENKQSGSSYNGGDMTSDFHVYGLEFNEQYLRWFTDGKMVREITQQSHPDFFRQWTGEEKYTMLNIHLTDKYTWLGKVDKSKFPFYMYIDYFRIYEEVPTKVNNQNLNKELKIFPNPANQKAHLFSDNNKLCKLLIFNQNGELMFEDSGCVAENYELNVSGFPRGIYFLRLEFADKVQSTKLLIN
jgi:beta-glucanase (GH16 family)